MLTRSYSVFSALNALVLRVDVLVLASASRVGALVPSLLGMSLLISLVALFRRHTCRIVLARIVWFVT